MLHAARIREDVSEVGLPVGQHEEEHAHQHRVPRICRCALSGVQHLLPGHPWSVLGPTAHSHPRAFHDHSRSAHDDGPDDQQCHLRPVPPQGALGRSRTRVQRRSHQQSRSERRLLSRYLTGKEVSFILFHFTSLHFTSVIVAFSVCRLVHLKSLLSTSLLLFTVQYFPDLLVS